MSNQPRVVKVLAALLFSMTIGAVVLMSLGQNPPAAGLWSLSQSLRSDSPQTVVSSIAPQSTPEWNRIEVCFSGTKAGNIEQLTKLTGLVDPRDLDCHFVVCNGQGGNDGQVLATDKWLGKRSISSQQVGNATIRICVVGDGKSVRPTDLQIYKVGTLVNELSRMFDISKPPLYPTNWRS